ncbi:MAG TPA: septum formation initiator family protein [Patescibacteria group bacterium]|nr:septum formation initiator family protein [Patescibacteria group bacterium]
MLKKTKQKKTKDFFSFLTVIILVLVLFTVLLGVVREYKKRVKLDKEIASLQQELEETRQKEQRFLQSIEMYETEFFLEREARKKFNLKKPGEQVAVIKVDEYYNVDDLKRKGEEQKKGTRSFVMNNLRDWWKYYFSVEN